MDKIFVITHKNPIFAIRFKKNIELCQREHFSHRYAREEISMASAKE